MSDDNSGAQAAPEGTVRATSPRAPAAAAIPEDDVEPVQDLGAAMGGLVEMLDPKVLEGMKWQDAQMRLFHTKIKPRWDWMLTVLVAHARAQSRAAGLEVAEPPMPREIKPGAK